MFEKFTDKARKVMNLAQEEARSLGKMYVVRRWSGYRGRISAPVLKSECSVYRYKNGK